MIKVPRTMSTQHPDNVRSPFFASSNVLDGEDEIKEAFYTFSHLGCREQLWDCEGKEVDNHVVKKLLTRYDSYFTKNTLGKDIFLTLRAPNPTVEKEEAKILLETLESIPRSFDAARLFYNEDIAPIFEVAIPMIISSKCPVRVAEYYKRFVVGKKSQSLGDISIREWIGDFAPETIRVIPLLETKESMLNAHNTANEFISSQKIKDYQRIWLARSDPALNYGSLAAVLIEKLALQSLHKMQEKISVDILPILGCGSAPFRGNFTPLNAKDVMNGYPSVQTFTVQSAFKYDYPEGLVTKSITEINETKRKAPLPVDNDVCLKIIEKTSAAYVKQVKLLAPFINDFSKYIPQRRKRKLHIGLFGYARASHGTKLPRAITFCAALYSAGLPPEILGLDVLSQKDISSFEHAYPTFVKDLKDSLACLNMDNLRYFPKEIMKAVIKASKLVDFEQNTKHRKITSIIMDDYRKNSLLALEENIERAGSLRGFLG